MARIVFCLFISLTFCLSINAQSNSFNNLLRLTRNVYQFHELNPQEKVYLHFDNTGYYLGETIWFKAYIVLAGNTSPVPLSKLLHVELLTPEGEIIDSKKLKIENGQYHGEFVFDEEYRSGFYEIRAYTRGMLNFGEECIFSRVFPVYEKPEEDGVYSENVISQSYSLEKKGFSKVKIDKFIFLP